jgi:F5/8 type C domain/PASTA domain
LALLIVPSATALPPANDDFVNAATLRGDQGSQAGATVEATAEAGEPNHAGHPPYASVWYSWAPAVDGLATFDTCAASFDTRLAVYTGSALADLTEVASSDDSETCAADSLQSSVTFVAEEGVTYRIAIDVSSGETGTFTLRWKRAPLPPTNVTRPLVSGSPHEGETLSAGTGAWASSLPVGYTYQWQRCGAAQTNVALSKPTVASRAWVAGYEPEMAVDGSRWTYWNSGDYAPQWITVDLEAPYPLSKIRADITQLPDGYTVHELWVAGPNPKDKFQLLQTFAGETKDLDILERAGPPQLVEYILVETTQSPSWVAWREIEALSGCADIRGATGASYDLTHDDVGSTMRAVVKATNDSGTTAAASTETVAITQLAPVSTGAPTIAGTARFLETLTASVGSWRGSVPITYQYQWQRCTPTGACTNLESATDPDYVVGYPDLGATLRAIVTASNGAGSSSAASAPTALIPHICTVPKLKRRTLRVARRLLNRAHCSLGKVRHARSRTVRRGLIVSQRPTPGAERAAQARVSVVVSLGRSRRRSH